MNRREKILFVLGQLGCMLGMLGLLYDSRFMMCIGSCMMIFYIFTYLVRRRVNL